MGKRMSDMHDQPATPNTTTLELRAAKLQQQSDAAASNISRTMDVLRYYSWLQIARRATNLVKKRLAPSKKIQPVSVISASIRPSANVAKLARLIIDHRANHPSHVQVDLDRGRFVLLNHAVDLYDADVLKTQKLNQQTHLWRFQFHYHEFLLARAAVGEWAKAEAFLNQWLDDFAPEKVLAKDDVWHPYCISRRVVAWIWLLFGGNDSVEAHQFSPELIRRLVTSLVQQCEHLRCNLELDLGGNHLLENATALAIAGSVIDSEHAKGWEASAANVLVQQLPLQILAHGEHFERSPIYHGHMLGNLLRIEGCSQAGSKLREIVSPFVDPMLKHLGSIIHPDGEVPLFADSVFAESPSTSELLSCAQYVGREIPDFSDPSNLAQGQYRVLQSNDAFVICDFGPIAADNLPAHGHCDALNLEVSIAGDRWIVDSGNFNYSDDSMRHYCRSSIAHNVVTANHANHATVWDKFRMGKRPVVSPIQDGADGSWQWASSSHNGYRHLGTPRLDRVVAVSGKAVVCFDQGSHDGREPSGGWVGYVHFHPDVDLVLEHSDAANRTFQFGVSRAGIARSLTVRANDAKVEQGWFCPEFGKRQVSPVMRYDLNETEDFLGWVLHEQPISCEISDSQRELLITIGSGPHFRWSFSRSVPIRPSTHTSLRTTTTHES